MYQRDALSVISEAYDGFNDLLSTGRGNSESLKMFELRFSATVTRHNSLSNIPKPPQCIISSMLLSNAVIDHSQRVSVLAAAAPFTDDLSENSSNDELLAAVTYKQVASVVKQCERVSGVTNSFSSTVMVASTENKIAPKIRGRKNVSRKPSASVLRCFPCHVCGKYGP